MSEAIAVRPNAAIRRLVEEMRPENMPTVDDTAGLEKFALDMQALHDAYANIEAGAEKTRTLAGAYMHRARSLQGWKPAKIVEETGLSNASVSRYALIAELHFDLGFSAEDPEWPTLTNKLVTAKGFGPLMHPKKGAPPVQKTAVLEAVANYEDHGSIEPKAIESGPSVPTDGANGASTASRTPSGQRGPSVPSKLDDKVELWETLTASLMPTDGVSWATLHLLVEGVRKALDESQYKADGLERLAILDAKADADESESE